MKRTPKLSDWGYLDSKAISFMFRTGKQLPITDISCWTVPEIGKSRKIGGKINDNIKPEVASYLSVCYMSCKNIGHIRISFDINRGLLLFNLRKFTIFKYHFSVSFHKIPP